MFLDLKDKLFNIAVYIIGAIFIFVVAIFAFKLLIETF